MPGHGRLRGRDTSPHDGCLRSGSSNVLDARVLALGWVVQLDPRNDPAHVPAGAPRGAAGSASKLVKRSGGSGPIEQLAGSQHGMHDDGQFARNGNGGPLEAEPLAKLQPPCSQVAIGVNAGQDRRRGLVEQ